MNQLSHALAIFRKELVDVLRDRRTLLAMIVVPLVLYPLLLVVGAQALQFEKGQREADAYRVAVPDETTAEVLRAALAVAEQVQAEEREQDLANAIARGETTQPAGLRPEVSADQFAIEVIDTSLEDAVASGDALIAARLIPPPSADEPQGDAAVLGDWLNRDIQLIEDAAVFRSEFAAGRLEGMLMDFRQRLVDRYLQAAGLPANTLEPFTVRTDSVASAEKVGGAVLAGFLPFLLVIMTITGAIYPAIDLTVGERERGTLETLLVAPVDKQAVMAGKFLVVATIAVITTALNLVSMGLTFQLSGIAQAVAAGGSGAEVAIPLGILPWILLAMVPFAMLFSGLLLATCSFARSFKEAQNYMMPVILVGMLPAIATASAPSLELTPLMSVVPVANVVVMLRELFIGDVNGPMVALVLVSTSLYAVAAIAVASWLFGQEAVLFSDVGSYRSLLDRRLFRPRQRPGATSVLLMAAIVFPLSIYWQLAMGQAGGGLVVIAAVQMVVLFALPAVLLTWYVRADWRETLLLRRPPLLALVGGVLIAMATPWLGAAFFEWQSSWMGGSEELEQQMAAMFEGVPLWQLLIVVAVLPAIGEELFFRGALLSGLRERLPMVAVVLITAALFGLFHVNLARLPVTALLGVVLAIVAIRSGSIVVPMVVHFIHNGTLVVLSSDGVRQPVEAWSESVGWAVLLPMAGVLLVVGLAMVWFASPSKPQPSQDPPPLTSG